MTASEKGQQDGSEADQSAIGGMSLSTALLVAAGGWLASVPGAIAQEVIDVLTVLNVLRVAAVRRPLRDLECVVGGLAQIGGTRMRAICIVSIAATPCTLTIDSAGTLAQQSLRSAPNWRRGRCGGLL